MKKGAHDIVVKIFYNGDTCGTRRRYDNKMAKQLLKELGSNSDYFLLPLDNNNEINDDNNGNDYNSNNNNQ